MRFSWGLVGNRNGEIVTNHVDGIAAKLRAAQRGDRFSVHTLIGEISTGRRADFCILDTEALLPYHGTRQLFARHDTFVDVFVERMRIGLGTQFVSQDLAGRDAALKELQRRIDLREVLGSF